MSKVFEQQRQQVTDQREEQRVKDQQQEVNRQAQENSVAESKRNDADDRKGRSVDLTA